MQTIQHITNGAQQAGAPAQNLTATMAKPKAAAAAGSSTSTAPTSTAAASTITANDFLTLLVAEMKNQDPTQPTDPTQYISQMVNVNSLQQLIGINQGITSLDTAAGATGTGTTNNGG